MGEGERPRGAAAQFARGLTAPLWAARLLWRTPRLRRCALLPLAVNLLLFLLLFALYLWMLSGLDIVSWMPEWIRQYLGSAVEAAAWIAAALLYLFFFLFAFTPIGQVAASPFNDLLSARVEAALSGGGADPELPLGEYLRQTAHSLLSSLLLLGWQLLATLLVLPFLLIPFAGALPLFLVGAHFQALGFLDAPLARHFLRPAHRRAALGDRRWELLGLGVALELLAPVPLGGLLVLPLGVTAATRIYCEADWAGRAAAAGLPLPPGFIPPGERRGEKGAEPKGQPGGG